MDKRYSREEIGKRITERLKAQPSDNQSKMPMLTRLRDMAARQSRPTMRKSL